MLSETWIIIVCGILINVLKKFIRFLNPYDTFKCFHFGIFLWKKIFIQLDPCEQIWGF
jgi:hypothetical protein